MPAQAKGSRRGLTVAVTGPTGTFGFGLLPLLEADDRIARVIGIARRPFDPREHGWSKLEYRQGDVRDRAALEEAFADADVVVHLAFMITGTAARATVRAINVEGTLNAFHAAAAAGAQRFVYASSLAAYGFHPDNPVPMDESWPVRPAAHLFYAQEKAELEERLQRAVDRGPGPDLYLLRPPFVVGPHVVGGKSPLPDALSAVIRALAQPVRALGARVPLPVPVPGLPLQLIHEDDVGQALLQCIVAAGPPGAYNIAGDGTLTAGDLARRLGVRPVPVPARVTSGIARVLAATSSLPFLPPAGEWAEVLAHPAIMATDKAKRELHWTPRFTAREALDATVGASVPAR